MTRSTTIIFLVLIIVFACSNRQSEKEIKELKKTIKNGDLIFQTSKSGQSKAIQIATKSKYSHMGIVYQVEGEYFVYEAIQPVKLTPLKEWINREKIGIMLLSDLLMLIKY